MQCIHKSTYIAFSWFWLVGIPQGEKVLDSSSSNGIGIIEMERIKLNLITKILYIRSLFLTILIISLMYDFI